MNVKFEGCYVVYNQARFNVSFQLPINETVKTNTTASLQEEYKNLFDIKMLYSNASDKYNLKPGRFCQVTFTSPKNGSVECHLFPLEGRDSYHIKLMATRLRDGKILIDQYVRLYFNAYLDGFNCSMGECMMSVCFVLSRLPDCKCLRIFRLTTQGTSFLSLSAY